MKATKEARPTDQHETRQEYLLPEVDIFETKDGYVLEAEMPGVKKEGLEITLEGSELSIVGRRQTEVTPGQAVIRESSGRDYRRVFELDPVVDTGKIAARMDQGILTLTLPKSERVKPRRIAVE